MTPGLAMFSAAGHARFDAIARQVTSRGRGVTLTELGIIGALVRELEGDEPDVARVAELAAELGIEPGDIPR